MQGVTRDFIINHLSLQMSFSLSDLNRFFYWGGRVEDDFSTKYGLHINNSFLKYWDSLGIRQTEKDPESVSSL